MLSIKKSSNLTLNDSKISLINNNSFRISINNNNHRNFLLLTLSLKIFTTFRLNNNKNMRCLQKVIIHNNSYHNNNHNFLIKILIKIITCIFNNNFYNSNFFEFTYLCFYVYN